MEIPDEMMEIFISRLKEFIAEDDECSETYITDNVIIEFFRCNPNKIDDIEDILVYTMTDVGEPWDSPMADVLDTWVRHKYIEVEGDFNLDDFARDAPELARELRFA